ncbi:Mbeg1-like protein [Eubacterium sp. 1001713B170207_170306_E7]|uniref:Mbeg1-like protein n=1 Tax=Eubacterium sp. 1001713B170207_170306_E7 TaxID=2787097 RepID=UPI0018976983|nr:Mbeg1-like protein [Eubacterium sp. 1001713B170207_170306_E7]
MLCHSQLNLLSQLTALPLPVNAGELPIRVSEMVAVHRRHYPKLAGDAAMTSKEWRHSLELIQEDDTLMALQILSQADEPRNGLYGLCFSSDSPETGIITFRGTVGLGGWIDNYKGAFSEETDQQKSALSFFKHCKERFGFSHFDLAGHSKGGNDAQYITILNGEHIHQCVTFNSPGFSADFIGKYDGQIQENRDKITAYEGAYDIVNILLTSIAGKRLVIETGSKTPKNNHKPNHILDALGNIGLPGKRHPLYSSIQNMTVAVTFAVFQAKRNLKHKNKKNPA